MSVYRKLRILFKTTAEEPMRKVVEQNDIAIFEQEIRDAQALVKSTKLHLASVKAEMSLLKDTIVELEGNNNLKEEQIRQVMEKDETLAIDIAALLAEDELSLDSHRQQLYKLKSVETRITRDLHKAMRSIQSHQNQLVVMKANESCTKVSVLNTGSSNGLNASLRELNESMEAIKKRQLKGQLFDDAEQEVEDVLGQNGLNERLKEAGVATGLHDASAVLSRIKSETKGSS